MNLSILILILRFSLLGWSYGMILAPGCKTNGSNWLLGKTSVSAGVELVEWARSTAPTLPDGEPGSYKRLQLQARQTHGVHAQDPHTQ